MFSESRALGGSVLSGTSEDLLKKPVQAWPEWREQSKWVRRRRPGQWNISLSASETPEGAP